MTCSAVSYMIQYDWQEAEGNLRSCPAYGGYYHRNGMERHP